jgi:hypothetical protein
MGATEPGTEFSDEIDGAEIADHALNFNTTAIARINADVH